MCLDILSHCIDWNRVSNDHSPESICATLSPEHPDVSCISLQNYLFPAENPYHPSDGHVSSPCKGDPCESNEICTVNKNCMPGGSCTPYQCTPACKLGEVSISKTYLFNLINNNAHCQTFLLLHSLTWRGGGRYEQHAIHSLNSILSYPSVIPNNCFEDMQIKSQFFLFVLVC